MINLKHNCNWCGKLLVVIKIDNKFCSHEHKNCYHEYNKAILEAKYIVNDYDGNIESAFKNNKQMWRCLTNAANLYIKFKGRKEFDFSLVSFKKKLR